MAEEKTCYELNESSLEEVTGRASVPDGYRKVEFSGLTEGNEYYIVTAAYSDTGVYFKKADLFRNGNIYYGFIEKGRTTPTYVIAAGISFYEKNI